MEGGVLGSRKRNYFMDCQSEKQARPSFAYWKYFVLLPKSQEQAEEFHRRQLSVTEAQVNGLYGLFQMGVRIPKA